MVVRLRKAGAVVIGKTNLTELANFCGAHSQRIHRPRRPGPQPVRRQPHPGQLESGSGAAASASPRLPSAPRPTGRWCAPPLTEPRGHQADARSGAAATGSCPSRLLRTRRADVPHRHRCRGAARRARRARRTARGQGETLRGVRLAVPPEPGGPRPPDREVFDAALSVLRDRGAIPSRSRGCPRPTSCRCCTTSSPATSTPTWLGCRRGRRSGPCASSSRGTRRTPTQALKYGQVHLEKALAVDHEAEREAYERHRARGPRGGRRARHRRDPRHRARGGDRLRRPARLRGRGAGRVPEHGRAGRLPPASRWPWASASSAGTQRGTPARPRRCVRGGCQVRRPPSVVNPSLFRDVGGSPATAEQRRQVGGRRQHLDGASGCRSAHHRDASTARVSSSPAHTETGQRSRRLRSPTAGAAGPRRAGTPPAPPGRRPTPQGLDVGREVEARLHQRARLASRAASAAGGSPGTGRRAPRRPPPPGRSGDRHASNSGRSRSYRVLTVPLLRHLRRRGRDQPRAVVRPGYVAAKAAAYGPPTEIPRTATSGIAPTSSSSAPTRARRLGRGLTVDEP